MPLSEPAMKELLGLYAARRSDAQSHIPDAVTVYREDESDLSFAKANCTSDDDIYNNRHEPLKLQYFVLHRPNTKGASVSLSASKYGDAHGAERNSKANATMMQKLVGYVENERHKAAINMSVGRNGARQNGVTLAQEKQRMRDAEEKQRLSEENNAPKPLAALIGIEVLDESINDVDIANSEDGEVKIENGQTARCKVAKSAFVADIEQVSGTSVGGFVDGADASALVQKVSLQAASQDTCYAASIKPYDNFWKAAGQKTSLQGIYQAVNQKNRHRRLLPKLEARWRQSSIK